MSVIGRLYRALGLMDHSVAVVVFTVPAKRLGAMTVAAGPCVPVPGRKRPLVGLGRQDGGEQPEQTAALYTALTGGSPEDALRLVVREGRGRLFVCSAEFVAAMAEAKDLLDELARADEQPADADRSEFVDRYSDIDRAWLATGAWPRSVSATTHRLSRLHWAQAARDRGQHLYVWHGPAVPQYEVVAGDPGDA